MPPTSDVDSSNSQPYKPKRTHPVLLFLTGVLIATVIGLILWKNMSHNEAKGDNANYLAFTGFSNSAHTLNSAFKDADGDMVADAPTDPSKLVDPATIVFCYVATDDAEATKELWKPFTDYLSKATGKPVEYLLVTSTSDELEALHKGELQVAGFNTGGVPPAVYQSGFVPVCAVPAPDGGALTRTDIIVPADSSLQKPEDLKGHELTLTDPASNSGYKAPLVLLRESFNIQPISDIRLRYSYSHDVSIAGIVSHRYEAAAVADDMLSRQIGAGTITASQIRTIYQSEAFPTAGLGYVYNLKPELAQKVRDALLSFDWKGSSLEKLLGNKARTKFVPVNYKNDWALVRKIDDQMGLLSGL